MIEWIKIERNTESPREGEIVLVSDGFDWSHACYMAGKFYPCDSELYADLSDNIRGVTHWGRVGLPDGN